MRGSQQVKASTLLSNSWREIAAKEIHQSGRSAARVPLSIEGKGRLPVLTRMFGVGHIVAFPHTARLEAAN
jgi:hypothetical protein